MASPSAANAPANDTAGTPETDTLGARLRAARLAAGFTQDSAADHLDVHQSVVSKWELGQIRPPVDRLRSIAAAYGTTVTDLLEDGAR